ncbi:hypothetical protein KIN20_031068 [Parelaphostrongylus tenuis]|uniref:Uncharacterized protein n=1 Tax=Parelaphostrongylus tenuis TaxID=148309 RepID=A0AAD5R500_PARTN|nr:hypothetical protein KIN20_031068 [Parelaphostrongylus tenuis]
MSTVCGCGVMPAREASTRPFTVTGLNNFACRYGPLFRTKYPGPYTLPINEKIHSSGHRRLERQGRSALLPDAVISAILGQFSVTISYAPLSCQMSAKPGENLMMVQSSVYIIVDNGVTEFAQAKMENKMCGNQKRTRWKYRL